MTYSDGASRITIRDAASMFHLDIESHDVAAIRAVADEHDRAVHCRSPSSITCATGAFSGISSMRDRSMSAVLTVSV